MKRAISVDKTVSNQFLSTESGVFVDKIHQGRFEGEWSSWALTIRGDGKLWLTLTFPDDPDPLTRGAKCEK